MPTSYRPATDSSSSQFNLELYVDTENQIPLSQKMIASKKPVQKETSFRRDSTSEEESNDALIDDNAEVANLPIPNGCACSKFLYLFILHIYLFIF